MSTHTTSFNRFYQAQSVVIFGASEREHSVGASIVKNFLRAKPTAQSYFINPKHAQILGYPAYKSLEDVPIIPELAVIATPALTIYPIVESLCRKGVKAIIVISAGLKDVELELPKIGKTTADKALELLLKQYPDVRLIGPNCFGLASPINHLDISFAYSQAPKGSIALVSQSGGMIASLVDWAYKEGLGFSHIVSLGDQMQVSFQEILEDLADRDECRSVALYVEGIKDAKGFIEAARKLAHKKPVIAIKSGTNQISMQAAVSHTGSIMSNDKFYDILFERAGVVRAKTLNELLLTLKLLHSSFEAQTSQALILSNGGGFGVMAVDQLIAHKHSIIDLNPLCKQELDAFLPSIWSGGNPIDIIGDASFQRYLDTLSVLRKYYPYSPLFLLYVPTGTEEPMALAKALVQWSKEHQARNILVAWTGHLAIKQALDYIQKESNLPVFETAEDAVNAFSLYHKIQNPDLAFSAPLILAPTSKQAQITVQKLLKDKQKKDQLELNILEIKDILEIYEIPFVETWLCKTPQDIHALSKKIVYPVAIKIHTNHSLHKSDIGGAVINIQNEVTAIKAMEKMQKTMTKQGLDAKYEGFLVQRMIPLKKHQYELLLGVYRDELFGHFLSFGAGGTAVELTKDVSTEWVPFNFPLAKKLVHKTQIYQLLKGYRSFPALDLESIYYSIMQLNLLICENPQIQELDLNPLIIDEDGFFAVDARIRLESLARKSI